jgi:hypothetical protein
MRAHTTTNAKTGARRRTKRSLVPGGILALSLAVVLLGGTASTASTTPTPPLTLSVDKEAFATHKLRTHATTSNDSTLVVRGDVKRTTKQSAAGEPTKFKARLKHPERLRDGKLTVKIKVAATDEFGQTATDKAKYVLRRCPDRASVNYGTTHFCEG